MSVGRGGGDPAQHGRRALAPAVVVVLSALAPISACLERDATGEGTGQLGGVAQAGAAGVRGVSGTAGSGGVAGASGKGGVAGAAGAGGRIVNSADCPALEDIRMNDPCGVEGLVCFSPQDVSCRPEYTCRHGGWKLHIGGLGPCNPPTPCPDAEPAQPDTDWCSAGFYFSPAVCRYAHAGCFAYLTCGNEDDDTRWHAGALATSADSCCPHTPATAGDGCATPGLLCPGTQGEVVCADGQWAVRKHQHVAPPAGVGGGGQGGDSGGGPGGSGGSGWMWGGSGGMVGGAAGTAHVPPPPPEPPDPNCPEKSPLMNDPCVLGTHCNYDGFPCGVRAECPAGRWTLSEVDTPFCVRGGVCPSDEPEDVATGVCDQGDPQGSAATCRYPRPSGCFSYLRCSQPGETPRWLPDAHANDGCCPAKRPTTGAACADEGVLCAWKGLTATSPKVELICRDGAWLTR